MVKPSGAKSWHLHPHDAAAIVRLGRELNVSPILAQLLCNRKVTDPQAAQRFLTAPLKELHEPERLPGVPQAVDRILKAIGAGRRICVYGDYDVDGVTGTAILLTCLKHLGAQVDFHVPHRLEEGYGLNSQTLTSLAERGFQTIVTVDCGICSMEEVRHAKSLGLEVIITDHHEPKGELPEADVIIHPRLPYSLISGGGGLGGANGSTYPFGSLCGSAVAFKLAWALCKKHCNSDKVTPVLRDFLMHGITLAALGTVADVVPLFEENRILVRHGLTRLKQQPCLGLKALLRCAKLEGKSAFDTMDVGYTLAPRINAAGRLGTARLAVELLTTLSPDRATTLADFLERQNQQRQQIERRILTEARGLAELEGETPALVLANADWHPGLLGIVASRLADQFGRPVLMIALPEGQPHGQGSGRSIPGFALHSALEACTQDLISHGGHASAAGFRIVPDLIPTFRNRFFEVVSKQLGAKPRLPRLSLDAEVPLAALTPGFIQGLQKMEPFGAGNPQPLLLAGPVQVVGEPRKVGNGELHLSFRIQQQGRTLKAIAFGMADRLPELMSESGRCCIAFTPRFNEYQGQRWVEIQVKDFQAGNEARLENGTS